jgi:ferritin-like metal-binding protein YciE
MRQVGSYWDMAASLVLHGAINEELFLEPGICGEMFFIFAKVYPFLKEIRAKMNNPDVFANIEKVATGSKLARKRLERVLKNIEQRRKAQAKPAKKG